MASLNQQWRIVDIAHTRGKEIFEITPVILGGSGSDPQNKVLLSRQSHIEAVRYWNGVIVELRASAASEPVKKKGDRKKTGDRCQGTNETGSH
jgi:hypothetical protein